MTSCSIIKIHKRALLNNLTILKNLSPDTIICPVVKANAYGHGLKPVLDILVNQDIHYLGVHSAEEGILLRKYGFQGRILVMGYVSREDCGTALDHGLELGVCNLQTLDALAGSGKPAQVHLKLETGTNRQGIAEPELENFISFIKSHDQVNLQGVYTHFANIEDTTDPSTALAQLERFKKMLDGIRSSGLKPCLIHTACSAAHLLFPETRFDLVRPGIALYGYWPSRETLVSFRERNKELPDLQPVLSWHSHIGQIKPLSEGETVGYGCTYKVQSPMKIGVIPVGYYDGYSRSFADRAFVLIHGKRAQVLGRICMDMFMVDITHVQDVDLEDEVVLLGKQDKEEITASDMADWGSTIHYEVLSRLNPEIERVITD
jgi:alanine racemase